MSGKIFITRHGYDPQKGGYIKDPCLDGIPKMGACHPDIRKKLNVGDSIFVVSGKVRGFDQFIIGCFDIQEKITMQEAYKRFPEQRLHVRYDGQLAGNVIINEDGTQHSLDNHKNFEGRLSDYVIGENKIVLESEEEIETGREQTLGVLSNIFYRTGKKPIDILTRGARNLDPNQVQRLKNWLHSVKQDNV